MTSLLHRWFLCTLMVAFAAPSARAVEKRAPNAAAEAPPAEEVTFAQDGRQRSVTGRVITEAADGGLLVESDDGVLWSVERDEIVTRKHTDAPFQPLASADMAERLLSDLPPGFRVHTTPHYVVCYNTSRAYAVWTSSLLERLYKAFTNYWENQGLELCEPEFPLPVLVFADRQMYDHASREDLPGGVGSIVGFYSLRSNRVNMFDLTGAEALRGILVARGAGSSRGSLREINQMLAHPAAEPLVATIVHEATHPIAFNCGLARRYADLPLWLCEGMAVYFEAPDIASTRGWRGIGRINHARLATFQENLPNWHADSLEQLVTTDRRFRDPQTAVAAYADAWALNYYLIKYKPSAYTAYVKMLAERRPLITYDAEARRADFCDHFGDPRRLERDFLKQMARVK